MKIRSVSRQCAAAGVVLIALLFAGLAVTRSQQEPSKPVTLTLTVTDKTGRYVGGLDKDQVFVFEEGLPQEIVSFQKVDIPVSVGFVFDRSFLKMNDVFRATHEALLKFVADGHPQNEYFVMGFGEQVYSGAQFVKDRDQLAGALAKLRETKASDGKALYDAIGSGIELAGRGANAKQAIVLISDDKDDSSKLLRTELFESLKRREVLLYVIRLRGGRYDSISPVFEDLSAVTGGKTFYPKGFPEFTDMFEIIGLELRHQYSLQYKSQTSSPGAWRNLKFVVQPLLMKNSRQVELFVRGRSGYYK